MSRVESSSGARYSAHNEQPRKFEPIAPVGTNYTPVGKIDINALKKAPTPTSKLPATTRPAFSAPGFSASSSKPAMSAGSLYGRTVISGSAPQDAWPDEAPAPAPAPPSPPPAASRPPVLPTASRPTASRTAFSAVVRHLAIFTLPSNSVLLIEDTVSCLCAIHGATSCSFLHRTY